MIKQPPYLKRGDTVAIVCPAKKLSSPIDEAVQLLESWGLRVITGKTVYGQHHQFAGTDELRRQDIQQFLDDATVKAIIAGRGGYGTIRIIDELDFSNFVRSPKWLVGFSDITVLLSHVFAQHGTASIHAQMPYTFKESTALAMESLRAALFGDGLSYHTKPHWLNQIGSTKGMVIGGNLSLLLALEGSVSEMDFDGKILFIEDVGEHEYAIDRMMRTLLRKGKLANLAGLVVGAFNGMATEPIPFGQTPEEVIASIVKDYEYPICYGFPVGHINDNRALVLGKTAQLSVEENIVTLNFL